MQRSHISSARIIGRISRTHNSVKTILSLVLLSMTLLISGCGYDSYAECKLKEMQKCSSESCREQVHAYCDSEVPMNLGECYARLLSIGVQSDELVVQLCDGRILE